MVEQSQRNTFVTSQVRKEALGRKIGDPLIDKFHEDAEKLFLPKM
jgi:hypothetical protein